MDRIRRTRTTRDGRGTSQSARGSGSRGEFISIATRKTKTPHARRLSTSFGSSKDTARPCRCSSIWKRRSCNMSPGRTSTPSPRRSAASTASGSIPANIITTQPCRAPLPTTCGSQDTAGTTGTSPRRCRRSRMARSTTSGSTPPRPSAGTWTPRR